MADYLYDPPTGNVTTTTDMMQWLNGSVSNIIFPGIIISVFFIMMAKMLTNQNSSATKSFASASFVCMILAVFGRVLDLVNTGFMSIWIVFVGIAVVAMYIENNK